MKKEVLSEGNSFKERECDCLMELKAIQVSLERQVDVREKFREVSRSYRVLRVQLVK